jgi:glycerophosphoryl diester phosphodiesterase
VTPPPPGELEIIAHRGYSARAPENTLAAVDRAIEAGADAIEWDIHVAACGTPVLIHDDTLERTTTGAGPVVRQTLAALKMLDAGGWFGPAFRGERIPSLGEALERTRGRVRRVYTEVKGYRAPEDLDRIVAIVRDAGRLEEHVFLSFDWAALDRIAGQDERTTIGYLMDTPEAFDEAVARAAARERALIDSDQRLILKHPELARRALERGLEVAVWTVDDADQATRLRQAGVTRFTTNEVEDMLRWRAAAS